MMVGWLLAGLGNFLLGWLLWPTGISYLTLSSITFGMLASAIGSFFAWLLGAACLMFGALGK